MLEGIGDHKLKLSLLAAGVVLLVAGLFVDSRPALIAGFLLSMFSIGQIYQYWYTDSS